MDSDHQTELITLTMPKFIIDKSNSFGMLGTFQGIQERDVFFTEFIPYSPNKNTMSPIIKICQHENLEQAEWMAEDMNKYSSQM